MGWDNARPLPACVYHSIRTKYESQQRTGYATAMEREATWFIASMLLHWLVLSSGTFTFTPEKDHLVISNFVLKYITAVDKLEITQSLL